MRVWIAGSCKGTIRFVWIVVITALVPLPVAAGEPGSVTRTNIREAVTHIVARDVSATPVPPSRARAARQGSTSTASTSFFKSRPGMIALVVAAVGTGYAIYSAQHDRIHSAGKQ
jgi:hypothetical protein